LRIAALRLVVSVGIAPPGIWNTLAGALVDAAQEFAFRVVHVFAADTLLQDNVAVTLIVAFGARVHASCAFASVVANLDDGPGAGIALLYGAILALHRTHRTLGAFAIETIDGAACL
jgi:hypothetical protein